MPKPHVKGIEEPGLRTFQLSTLDPKRTALGIAMSLLGLSGDLLIDLDVAF
jgi:hypothetical protein